MAISMAISISIPNINIYLSVVDEVLIYDNSGGKPELIAEKTLESEITILNETKFNKLKNQYHENL